MSKCSIYGCPEPPVMVLKAKPSGMRLTPREKLAFEFCLVHGAEYRALGYQEQAA